jgi:hypothetical protein
MLLDDTPNTVVYMLAGYAVLLGFPLLYAASWFWRRRRLKRELDMLQALAKEKAAPQGPESPKDL